jgi:hypothetical protein
MPSKNVFIIFGYSPIPQDVMNDENYNIYLKVAFNYIYSIAARKKKNEPIILFCGGNTDTIPPYQRTEAEELSKLFKSLQGRLAVKESPFSFTLTSRGIL